MGAPKIESESRKAKQATRDSKGNVPSPFESDQGGDHIELSEICPSAACPDTKSGERSEWRCRSERVT